MELIVEQVSRSKKLLSRHKVCGPHISIGRGYDNDVIINDPYVDANQLLLSINQEGRWQVKDEGSINGSYFENEGRLNHPRPIRSGEVISIGKSFLRFIYPDHPVAPTIRLSGMEGTLNWLSRPFVVFTIFMVYALLEMLKFYMATTEIKTSRMFSTIFANILVMSMLPMLFGLLARLFKHDARVLTQMALWYCFFIAFSITGSVGTLISFNSSSALLSTVFVYVTEIALIFMLLWSAFYIAFHQSPLRRLLMVGGATCSIVVLGYLYTASRSADFNINPIYDNTLLAPEFAIVEPVTIEQFIDSSESIFDLAEEKVAVKQ